jgi:hypothetical protein
MGNFIPKSCFMTIKQKNKILVFYVIGYETRLGFFLMTIPIGIEEITLLNKFNLQLDNL